MAPFHIFFQLNLDLPRSVVFQQHLPPAIEQAVTGLTEIATAALRAT